VTEHTRRRPQGPHSRVGRRGFIRGTAAGAALGSLALAGCGTRGARPSSASGASAQPKSGGSLNLRIFTDFFDFDMTYAGKSTPNANAATLAYDTLLGFQQGPGQAYDHMQLTPRLAEKWEVSPDATTFTFHLRKGAKFASLPPVNGREFTSDDVKWNLEYYSRSGQFKDKKLPEANFAWMLEGLDSVQTPDLYTAVVRFKQPFAPFLNYTYTYALVMAPHEIFDQYGDLKDHLVGTGPYQLSAVDTQKGTRWVFKRNPAYWQSGRPYLDEIRYLVISDDSAAYAAFQGKQLDLVNLTDPKAAQAIAANSPAALTQASVDPVPDNLYMSVRRPPFNDERLRRAVSFAIDRDEFDKTLAEGKGGWALSFAFPDSWTQAEARQILKYDPQQAAQLVPAAGFANGLNVELLLRDGGNKTAAQLIQAQLKKVGINVDIKPVDKASGSQRLYKGDFTMIELYENTYADPDSVLYGQNYSTSSADWIGVTDPALDKLIDAQRREADPAKRRDAVRAASRYIADHALSLALWRRVQYEFWQPSLKGYASHWQQNDFNAPNIWLDRG
jgi:peptide/nickel transport system substrate-binding protein